MIKLRMSRRMAMWLFEKGQVDAKTTSDRDLQSQGLQPNTAHCSLLILTPVCVARVCWTVDSKKSNERQREFHSDRNRFGVRLHVYEARSVKLLDIDLQSAVEDEFFPLRCGAGSCAGIRRNRFAGPSRGDEHSTPPGCSGGRGRAASRICVDIQGPSLT